MAFATRMSIGTGTKVSVDYQSHDVSINVSYELERADTDLLQLIDEKVVELELLHTHLWERIRELRAARAAGEGRESTPATTDHPVTIPVSTNGNSTQPPAASNGTPPEPKAPAAHVRAITALVKRADISDAELQSMLQERFHKNAADELSKNEAAALLQELQRREREKAKPANAK